MSSIAEQAGAKGLSQSLSDKIAAAQSWPANWVAAGGLLLFAVAWTIHGMIAGAGGTLHFDLLEAYAWGKEFQLGYNQHGPFWAWIAGAWFLVFPVANWPFILLQAINWRGRRDGSAPRAMRACPPHAAGPTAGRALDSTNASCGAAARGNRAVQR